MREKTAEEKLREELEGGASTSRQGESSGRSRASRRSVRVSGGRGASLDSGVKRSGKPEGLLSRVDSFMDDLESMI